MLQVNIRYESSTAGIQQRFLHPGRVSASHARPGDLSHPEGSRVLGAVSRWRAFQRISIFLWFPAQDKLTLRRGRRSVLLSDSINFLCSAGLSARQQLKDNMHKQGATCLFYQTLSLIGFMLPLVSSSVFTKSILR